MRFPLLLVGILVPCAALGALGVRALLGEASQAERRFRDQADLALDTAVAAVDATASGLPASVPGAIGFTLTPEGDLVDPPAAAESRPAGRGSDPGAVADLLLSVLTEADRLERSGDLSRAAGRMREFLKSGPPSEFAAAALTSLAAIEKKRGELDAAKEAWSTIVRDHASARDARGLKRSFAARLALLGADRSAGDPVQLYSDVVDDDRDPARPGTSAFKREIRSWLASDDGPVRGRSTRLLVAAPGAVAADARDRVLALERQLRAALIGGVREWVLGGGRGVRTFVVSGETRAASDPATGPVRLVVTVREAPSGAISGGASPLDAVLEAAVARPEVRALDAIGFPVTVQSDPRGGPTPPRSLGDVLGGVLLGVSGADLDAFRKNEQRRLVVTAGLAGLGMVVAAGAAVATTRAIRREQRTVQDRENFVAAVTHELRAPLASIRLLAEVLARGGVEDEKVREFAVRAIGECDRLGRLVSGILELARIEREPGLVAKLSTVDAVELANAVMRTFEPVARERGFALTLRVADPGIAIAGDRDALVGALVNLLDNAVKYSEPPGPIEVEVAAAGRHQVAFSVLDRGRGVPEAEARRIFEPFARLGSEMTRDRPGVGLGLALVNRVAAAHGGTASCEPRQGGGSRFTVVLPLATPGAS